MAYYLLIDNDESKRFLEIPKIYNKKTKKGPKYKSPVAFSLEEIDKFTTMFENENDMKEYLLAKGKIKENELDKDIIILKKYQNYYNKINHNLIFKKYKEYLNAKDIAFKIKNREKDTEFLETLLRHYNSVHMNDNVYNNSVRDALATIKEKMNGNDELTGSLSYYIGEFVKTELYFKSDKLGYKALRDLAIFMCNYETKEALKKAKERLNAIKEENNNSLNKFLMENYKPYGLPRIKEEDGLTRKGGQMSLFGE